MIKKKKKSLQPINTGNNFMRQISNISNSKEYLKPKLPNVTEECQSGTSNISKVSIKKEMRKKI